MEAKTFQYSVRHQAPDGKIVDIDTDKADAMLATEWKCPVDEAQARINRLFAAYDFDDVIFRTDTIGAFKYVRVMTREADNCYGVGTKLNISDDPSARVYKLPK